MAIIEALHYLPATIVAIFDESPRAKTFRLHMPGPYEFVAGQHCILRIPIEDNFKVSREYSFSSAPSSGYIDITVGKVVKGEVSNWLHTQATVGTTIEITKPLGEVFTWRPESADPVLLIAGGIGITPLMSMWREHMISGSLALMKLVYKVKSHQDMCFKDELMRSARQNDITIYHKEAAGRRTGLFEHIALHITPETLVYICGSPDFVFNTKSLLIGTYDHDRIKTEKFT